MGTAKLHHILPWYLRTQATFLPFQICAHFLSITRFRGSELLGTSPCFTGELQGRQLGCRSTTPPDGKSPFQFPHCPLFGIFGPHFFSMVFQILYPIFPSPNFA